MQENQARRLLNDLDSYRAATDRQGEDEAFVAHDWLTDVFEPAVRAVPRELRGKLEPAQMFHELLDHRWFISREQGRDVPMREAATATWTACCATAPTSRRFSAWTPGRSRSAAVEPDGAAEGPQAPCPRSRATSYRRSRPRPRR